MPLGNWNLEWANHNQERQYPLADDATATDLTGTFRLPESFLVACYLPVHAGLVVDTAKFFLRKLGVFATGYAITIAYDDGTDDPPLVGTAIVARSSHAENASYALPGVGDFDDVVGKVQVGRLAEIDALPAGEYTFNYAGGKLDTDCPRPLLRGVAKLTVVQAGGARSAAIYGDVEFQAGSNIQLTTSVAPGGATRIRIDAIDSDGFADDCACAGQPDPPPCIRTINGIPPRDDGDFDFLGSECVRIDGGTHALTFVDTCSSPCCGCPELEALTAELDHFGDEALTLRGFVDRLKAQVDQMDATILSSRLNDNPCVSC